MGYAIAESARAGAATEMETLVAILGVPFHCATIEGAVDRIDEMVGQRGSHYVVTPNVDFLVKAQRDDALRRILVHADLVLCDGKPIVWASRWLGQPLPGRVAGADLVPSLLKRAEERGWRIFILGGSPAAASEAARRIGAAHPALPPVAHYSPPVAPLEKMEDAEIMRRVSEARPHVMLVCFGCPKQEKWIWRNFGRLRVPVAVGAGATVDFLANRVARAPEWMRRSGTEWVFRLLQEPRRLAGRYADDILHFLPSVLRQAWWQAKRPRRAKPEERP